MSPGAPLIPPHGGTLVDLLVPEGERDELYAFAQRLPSLQLSERSVCDLELLAVGAFSPLDRFMGKVDHDAVLREMRLASGLLFPVPVTLPIDASAGVEPGRPFALRDRRNELLAVLDVEESWEWSLPETARLLLGTEDARHPLVAEMHGWGRLNVSGRLRVLRLPFANGFEGLRLTPAECRRRLHAMGRSNVVAFQTRNPLHRAHEELLRRAMDSLDASLLLHPVVGLTKPGDVDQFTRVRTYQVVTESYLDRRRVLLALLPLAMRMAGPREALWHAVIRRNYGASHLIVGRDHAGAGRDSAGRPFHDPYAAQELVARHQDELFVRPVPFQELVYLSDEERYEEADKVPAGATTVSISGTAVREEYLDAGRALPSWFTRPEVAEILAEAHPPRHRQGACVWFTGLPCAGKSTIAEALTALLLERGRRVTLLDGDVVRTLLSSGLGFTRKDRDTNVRRIAFVASEIVRHGGIAVCAAVSPYRAARNEARALIGNGAMAEVHVATPLAVCEERDAKGMYAKARRGELERFTGVDDPYEAPLAPEIVVDAATTSAASCARAVLAWLIARGLVRAESAAASRELP